MHWFLSSVKAVLCSSTVMTCFVMITSGQSSVALSLCSTSFQSDRGSCPRHVIFVDAMPSWQMFFFFFAVCVCLSLNEQFLCNICAKQKVLHPPFGLGLGENKCFDI